MAKRLLDFFQNSIYQLKLIFSDKASYEKSLFILSLTFLIGLNNLQAATTATATITYTIGSIDAITVSGNPGAFTVNSATAGSSPSSVTDTSTTYSVSTNNTARRITAALTSAMPTGVTLGANLAAPPGATSTGNVNLTTTFQALVTAIANLAQAGVAITYTFTATLSAAQVSAATNTVTYTIGP